MGQSINGNCLLFDVRAVTIDIRPDLELSSPPLENVHLSPSEIFPPSR